MLRQRRGMRCRPRCRGRRLRRRRRPCQLAASGRSGRAGRCEGRTPRPLATALGCTPRGSRKRKRRAWGLRIVAISPVATGGLLPRRPGRLPCAAVGWAGRLRQRLRWLGRQSPLQRHPAARRSPHRRRLLLLARGRPGSQALGTCCYVRPRSKHWAEGCHGSRTSQEPQHA